MVRCSFCGGNLPEGRGKMYVRNDGKVFYFCQSKCQSNWRKGREGKSVRWTQTFRQAGAGQGKVRSKARKPEQKKEQDS
jgi:large subunit ribosomal protein L24e